MPPELNARKKISKRCAIGALWLKTDKRAFSKKSTILVEKYTPRRRSTIPEWIDSTTVPSEHDASDPINNMLSKHDIMD